MGAPRVVYNQCTIGRSYTKRLALLGVRSSTVIRSSAKPPQTRSTGNKNIARRRKEESNTSSKKSLDGILY